MRECNLERHIYLACFRSQLNMCKESYQFQTELGGKQTDEVLSTSTVTKEDKTEDLVVVPEKLYG